MRMRIKLPIRKPRPNPADRMLCDIQAAGSVPFATQDHRGLSWIVFVEERKDHRAASLIGFEDEARRDYEYETAKTLGGNFSRILKAKGPELGVRQLIDSRGWVLDATPIIRG